MQPATTLPEVTRLVRLNEVRIFFFLLQSKVCLTFKIVPEGLRIISDV